MASHRALLAVATPRIANGTSRTNVRGTAVFEAGFAGVPLDGALARVAAVLVSFFGADTIRFARMRLLTDRGLYTRYTTFVAGKLKDFFDRSVVTAIARSLRGAAPGFNERAFVTQAVDGLDDLELVGRGAHIATAMRAHLPASYAAAIEVIIASLGFELSSASSMASFRYLPHTMFVSAYGLDDFATSMRAQYELTQRFTAEFSIRTFLENHPDKTLAMLATWAADPSEHVRRLVSEGTRPRLPWAPRLRAFMVEPSPVLSLLERLKDDPALYVRRSVANNLNDIAKDHPDRVIEVCRRWLVDATPERRWIVSHALRSLVKQGSKDALRLLGAGATPKITIEAVTLPKRVKLGDALTLSFELASTSARVQDLLVDVAVHFVKANGARSPKVFKLRRVSLGRDARLRLQTTVSFANLTTRKHYPGRHAVDALVNGMTFPLGELDVVR